MVVGDVAGSGLSAAVIMGRIRSALRAYALEFPGPADVLRKLDHKMQYFEENDVMATVSYAVLDPDSGQLAHLLGGPSPAGYRNAREKRTRPGPDRCRSADRRRQCPPACRSPRWLSGPVPWCACSPTAWSNAGTSESMTASPAYARP